MELKKFLLPTIITTILFGGGGIYLLNTVDGNDKLETSSENRAQTQKTDASIKISHDINSTNELSEMVNESDTIVIGYYKEFDSIWNMAGESQNTDENVEGKLYNFKVEEVLLGDLDAEEIKINHRYSQTIEYEETSGDEIVSPEGILIKEPSKVTIHKLKNFDPSFVEPEINTKYMVFLKKYTLDDQTIYLRAIEPYLIQFDINNMAILQSKLIDFNPNSSILHTNVGDQDISISNDVNAEITDQITGMTLDQIKNKITNEIQ